MMKCLCGCLKEVDSSQSRGERKLFYDDACKSRYNRQKKRVVSVSASQIERKCAHPDCHNMARSAGKRPGKYCSERCAERTLYQKNRTRILARRRRPQTSAMHPRYRPLEERFWEKVEKTRDGCWVWTGSRHTHKGKLTYGVIRVDGKNKQAHRISYELAHGSIPEGMNVLHHCDNPPCVRPDHLFLGTQKDNARDMTTKGRRKGGIDTANQLGEKNRQAKLTAEQVQTIRQRYANGGIYMKQIACEFGISITTVSQLINRERWEHLHE